MSVTRGRLLELRAVGERLALGDAEARKVRGLLIDVIDVLLGNEANHIDVNNSGARHAPPDPLTLGAQRAGYAAPPPGVRVLTGAPASQAAPDPNVADPAGPNAIEEMELELLKLDETKNAGKPATTPIERH